MPQWQTLPAETPRSITKLMVSLISDRIDSDRILTRKEARHDACEDRAASPETQGHSVCVAVIDLSGPVELREQRAAICNVRPPDGSWLVGFSAGWHSRL